MIAGSTQVGLLSGLPGKMNIFQFFKNRFTGVSGESLNYYLCLGAGPNQVPLIQAARELGLRVIAVDRDLKAPGLPLADIQIQCSLDEPQKIHQLVLENLGTGSILAVGGRSFGALNVQIARVAQSLSVRGPSPEKLEAFSSKRDLKIRLARAGVPSPRIYGTKNERDLEKLKKATLPLIVRPSDGSAKLGIEIISSEQMREDLLERLTRNDPRKDSLFIEEYVDAPEYIVIGYLIDGIFHPVTITRKEISKTEPHFVDESHRLATDLESSLRQSMVEKMQIIAKTTGLKNGPLLAEFLVPEKKKAQKHKVLLVEAAPEIGGEFLADHFIPEVYGYNYFKEIIKLQTESATPEGIMHGFQNPTHAVVIHYILQKDGVVSSITFPDALKKHRGFLFARELKGNGDRVSVNDGNLGRIAVFAIKGPLGESDHLFELAKEFANATVVHYKSESP